MQKLYFYNRPCNGQKGLDMYDYKEAMKKDIREWIDQNDWFDDHDLDAEELNEALWAEDDVTGNGCYGYPDKENVKQYVLDNTRLCLEALREFCTPANDIVERFFEEDWAYLDTTIRCYMLYQAVEEVVDEIDTERREVV